MNSKLAKVLIGKNYKEISKCHFNIYAFIFEHWYLLYHKIYLYSIMLFMIKWGILFFMGVIEGLIFMTLVDILYGLFANKIYMNYAFKKVEQIKNKYNDETKQFSLCEQKSKPLISKSILLLLLFILICFIFLIIIAKIYDRLKYGVPIKYNYDIYMNEKYYIEVPKQFIKDDNNYELSYNYYENREQYSTYCRFSFVQIENYKKINKLVYQIDKYEQHSSDKKTSLQKLRINNINWNYFYYDNDYDKTYYYITSKADKLYLLKYYLSKIEADKIVECEKSLEYIINSIKAYE